MTRPHIERLGDRQLPDFNWPSDDHAVHPEYLGLGFHHVDEAKFGILDQRLVHAGEDEPWLAGHDPCIILPTPQESIRLVKRHGESVYQCNRVYPPWLR
jgi:hypothetical protein